MKIDPITFGPRDSVILMAGTCGNGRTVLIENILAKLTKKYSPNDLQLIICDTIGVSFDQYKDAPHLIKPLLTKPADIRKTLDWVLEENKRRTKLVKNKKVADFPMLIFVIDEFSYLFEKNKYSVHDFEVFLSEFTKLSRYANTHLILSTQKRDEKTITPLALGYMDTRIIFHCLDETESKRLLSFPGAENLKQGEFLFLNSAMKEPVFCDTKDSTKQLFISNFH